MEVMEIRKINNCIGIERKDRERSEKEKRRAKWLKTQRSVYNFKKEPKRRP